MTSRSRRAALGAACTLLFGLSIGLTPDTVTDALFTDYEHAVGAEISGFRLTPPQDVKVKSCDRPSTTGALFGSAPLVVTWKDSNAPYGGKLSSVWLVGDHQATTTGPSEDGTYTTMVSNGVLRTFLTNLWHLLTSGFSYDMQGTTTWTNGSTTWYSQEKIVVTQHVPSAAAWLWGSGPTCSVTLVSS